MELFLSKEAVKFLGKLSAKEAEKLREKLAALLEAIETEGIIPFNELDIKSLKGEWKGFLRMRVGKARIVFRIDAEADRLQVHDIDFRGNIYRSLRLFSKENDIDSG
ncbi:MAG: type II toxin-antitoxin system RelE/ParE family toxin [Oscillatoriophycideae cyanobacterium NC_groundwater_1537_Pr4_S-0.65um_50_18]|nr:type II toxin-antitoxin system RelE/ParE family toxin [Oscillatoriophycideae cyanobacterium NC_groundwater_1537_Pr4_S-0.65um_50_18]